MTGQDRAGILPAFTHDELASCVSYSKMIASHLLSMSTNSGVRRIPRLGCIG
jgi:hypothetical protein